MGVQVHSESAGVMAKAVKFSSKWLFEIERVVGR